MQLSKIIDVLRSRTTKNDVEIQIADIHKGYENTSEPYKSAKDMLRDKSFEGDDFLSKLESGFQRQYKSKHRMVDIISRMIEGIPGRTDVISKFILSEDSSLMIINDMTYVDLQCYRALDTFEFILKYSRWLLAYIFTKVTEAGDTVEDATVLAPAQIAWLREKAADFVSGVHTMDVDDQRLKRKLEEIPKVAVSEETAKQQMSVMGGAKLDPYGLVRTGFVYQTIYPVREAIEDWREKRRQAAITERQLLEYMILDLKAQQGGKNNMQVKRALEYQENRMRALNAQIAKMEEV